eukprot:CAMPEP_0118680962 /NCGR_PEP_ID=MMETSP0800-20121206/4668_1 /TAXON_ID=210618 ORGANISM="Striatella unipunctata, Strain CCMP2910" /NCGR_SAMPLE_ID=MMETSP0800 /ASSEMBLY_ACC=CAM_ASM_000638 /LENGTH=575 /DNA_ID=CAMNT_0006577193 /DNA_START=541 /DNA_END=2266 /DNA_ORIENTATION=+
MFGPGLGRAFRSASIGNESDYNDLESINRLGEILRDTHVGETQNGSGQSNGSVSPLESGTPEDNLPSFMLSDLNHGTNELQNSVAVSSSNANMKDSTPSKVTTSSNLTPMKPHALIPVDLLGELDDPSTPGQRPKATSARISRNTKSEVIKKNTSKNKKKSKMNSKELAAALFRPARSTAQIPTEDRPSQSGSQSASSYAEDGTYAPPYIQQQIDTTAQILLSMGFELGEEAAAQAAQMSSGNLEFAQYVINAALSAPPVCRHMLNSGCYRSDCQFSHEVEGHTCVFWLKGRCGKFDSCRFLHGFSPKLLESLPQNDAYSGQEARYPDVSPATSPVCRSIPIQTSNLVQHNRSFMESHDNPYQYLSKSQESGVFVVGSNERSISSHGSMESSSVSDTIDRNNNYPALGSSKPAQQASSFSFAIVATKGFDKESFKSMEAGNALSSKDVKTARIPQELWNPSINRNSAVFNIQDPLQRYREVAACHRRGDVIDLHFQSMKTFPVVLSTILSEKLREQREVWIVTGTGHHVSKKTHQKGGGALESGVISWLDMRGYDYVRGKDRNGFGGAVLVNNDD